jgi:hypothetical protein
VVLLENLFDEPRGRRAQLTIRARFPRDAENLETASRLCAKKAGDIAMPDKTVAALRFISDGEFHFSGNQNCTRELRSWKYLARQTLRISNHL